MMTPQRPNDIRRIRLKTLKIENSERSKNVYFLNVFQPKDAIGGDGRNDISVKCIKGEHSIGVEITSNVGNEIFLFSNENRIVFGDIEAQSKWVSVVKDIEGQTLKKTSSDGV